MSAPSKLYDHKDIDIAKITPREDWVLVRPDPPTRADSIVIPESAQDPRFEGHEGVVVRVGPGDTIVHYWCFICDRDIPFTKWRLGKTWEKRPKCPRDATHQLRLQEHVTRVPMTVKPGDRVLYVEGDHEIKIKGQKYFILHEEQHILSVLEPV